MIYGIRCLLPAIPHPLSPY